MKLIQVKIRGTGPLLESNWFQLSTGLNQFHFSTAHEGTIFLRALQSLHPLYSCTTVDPFTELPHYEKRGGHTRHIQASKRTIALGVFGATPDLVTELGVLDQNLYETDRVEIGRRLNYSLWLNFVELSSSTRWKEIESNILELFNHLPQQDKKLSNEVMGVLQTLAGPDRIRDDLAKRLLTYMDLVEDSGKEKAIFDETVECIKRDAHFQTAREVVFERLPLFVYFNEYGDINCPGYNPAPRKSNNHNELTQYLDELQVSSLPTATDNIVERIKTGIDLAISASSSLKRMPPIFLFDAPETNISDNSVSKLAQLIQKTAETYQCCYLCRDRDFFNPSETGKSYRSNDLKLPT